MDYPKELTPALREVLGMMCFELGPMAHGFRAAGYEINPRAEDEQAFMLHWLIPFALEHGDNWRKAASVELAKVVELAKAKAEPMTNAQMQHHEFMGGDATCEDDVA